MTAAQAVRMAVPPVEPYEPEPLTPAQKLIDRTADTISGLVGIWRSGLYCGELHNIQKAIDLAQQTLELLQCLQCEAHGQEV